MSRILGVRELRKLLPRPGFGLLLDRVEIESREKLTGLKVMTVNEEFFNGHFPNHPIMPGVLQIEAMKQLAELSARPELAKSAEEDITLRSSKRSNSASRWSPATGSASLLNSSTRRRIRGVSAPGSASARIPPAKR